MDLVLVFIPSLIFMFVCFVVSLLEWATQRSTEYTHTDHNHFNDLLTFKLYTNHCID